ncbi:hypothetical protein M758_4G062200 [Ceratodon purpureus]|nr:hypothetical protein M758_4G062200 [Ceratodon purpureus]
MGIMARHYALYTLVLLQLLCATYCCQGVRFDGGRKQLELRNRRLSTAPTSTNVFRSSLIHIDSLQTGTNASMKTPGQRAQEAVKRSLSRVKQLTSLQSPVNAISGDFVMQISFGTPPQEFHAIADTGSDLCWVQCSSCDSDCKGLTDNLFNPEDSETYSQASCTDSSCQALPNGQASCSSTQTCTYTYGYADTSNTQGDLAYETVTLDSSVPHIAFGCGQDQTGKFANADGLIGLGRGELSLPSQLMASSNVAKIFSYCLVDQEAASQGTTSLITFGDAAENSAATYTPLLSNANSGNPFYYVEVTGIKVGEMELDIQATELQINDDGTGGVILDSGTTLTYWTNDVFTSVSNAFQEQITYPQVEGSGDFTLCYDVSGESDVTFPGMVVHMTGADLETQGSNLFENVGSETYCLFMGTMGGSGIPGNIIGNRQQRDNIVVHY